MNKKRFALATISGFIFSSIFEFIVHGNLLMPVYEATADLWRPKSAMMDYMPLSTVISFLIIAVLVFIFTRHHEGKGISEGLRFGTMMGVLTGLLQFSMYVYIAMPITLAVAWFVASLAWLIGLGIIFSLTYKK